MSSSDPSTEIPDTPVPLAELLKQTPVMDILMPKQKVVSVQHDADVVQSFKTLVDEHILSAPVLENGRFVGFLDMKDLTHYVVFAVDQLALQERGGGIGGSSSSVGVPLTAGRRGSRGGDRIDSEAEALHARHTPQHTASPAPSLPTVPATPSAEDVAAALARPSPLRDGADDAQDGGDVVSPLPKHVQFLETAVRGLSIAHKDVGKSITNSYLARRHENACLPHTESLYAAACILARGAHRVAVLDDGGRVVNIVSQSSIVSFLSKHAAQLRTQLAAQHVASASASASETAAAAGAAAGSAAGSSVSAGLGTRPVVLVSESDSAFSVFRLMADRNLSGVPIVDEDGVWIGNTSGSDLKLYIRHPGLELLQQPIASFLAAIRQDEHGAKTRTPTIGVRSTASLWDVVQKLAATKVHRLFVADPPLFKPEAVISLTDVLRHLLPEATATATAGGASQHK